MSITAQKFVDGYKKATDDKKAEFVQKHIIRTYMPYEEKISRCETLVNLTSFVDYPDGNGDTKQLFNLNSPNRYCLFVMMVIDYYTDIESGLGKSDELLKVFNILDKENMIDVIFDYMGNQEITKLQTVLDMVLGDIIENRHSIASIIETRLSSLGGVFDIMLNGFAEAFQSASTGNLEDGATQEAETMIEQVK